MHNSIFIISHYKGRQKKYLENLISQLAKFKCQIGVIVNDDKVNKLSLEKIKNVFYLTRKNTGMNIGAWDEGYRYFNDYENYFFFKTNASLKNCLFLKITCYFYHKKMQG